MSSWLDILHAVIGIVILPLAGMAVKRYVKNAQLAQFADGAIAAAGRAAIAVQVAQQANPAATFQAIVDTAARAEAAKFVASYRETATALGATQEDALSRIKGELGKLLAPGAGA